MPMHRYANEKLHTVNVIVANIMNHITFIIYNMQSLLFPFMNCKTLLLQ